MNDKKILRKEYLNKRNLLTSDEVSEKSGIITKKLLETEQYKNAEAIFTYVSMGNEVSTAAIIESSLKDGKTVAAPVALRSGVMVFIRIWGVDNLIKSPFGVMEPVYDEKLVCHCGRGQLTLVVVPGLVFDSYGYRIGYGAGYYDRFLGQNPDAYSAGICYDFQLIPNVPAYEHDFSVDCIVTN